MSFIGANIRFLRKQKSLTQEELAQEMSLKRSAIGAYEEGRAEPRISTLQGFANFFGVSVDQFISMDLSRVAVASIQQQAPIPPEVDEASAEGKNLRVLSITVDEAGKENIELVPDKAAAGYLTGYADPEYLEELTKFHLPMLPEGTYRAFEISGDSMLPLQPGTVIIGEYVENWRALYDGTICILITGSEGIVCKRVNNHIDRNGMLTLVSDNPLYPPYEIPVQDIREIWKAKAYMSMDFPDPELSVSRLAGIVLDLQKEVIRMKGNQK